MRGFTAFLKKEFIEYIRNFKWIIFTIAFIFIGMSSSLLAKMMPDLLSMIDMEGMEIILPEPTAIDAYTQFFKNMTQMGIIILLLVFAGILSNELSKGSLMILLSKGLSRSSVILAKYTVAITIWTGTFIIASLINHAYTIYFFGKTNFQHLFFSLFSLWLFGAFILTLLILASTLMRGNYGGLLLTVGVLGILLVVNNFPKVKPYNPLALASDNLAILIGEVAVNDRIGTVLLTTLFIFVMLLLSLFVFERKKL